MAYSLADQADIRHGRMRGLRFEEGARLQLQVEGEWAAGTVEETFCRIAAYDHAVHGAAHDPIGKLAAYRVRLDTGELCYAAADEDHLVKEPPEGDEGSPIPPRAPLPPFTHWMMSGPGSGPTPQGGTWSWRGPESPDEQLITACATGTPAEVANLLRGVCGEQRHPPADVNCRPMFPDRNSGPTPLHAAVRACQNPERRDHIGPAVVEELLRFKPDLEAVYDLSGTDAGDEDPHQGRTAFLVAVVLGIEPVVRKLAEAGANVDAYWTPSPPLSPQERVRQGFRDADSTATMENVIVATTHSCCGVMG